MALDETGVNDPSCHTGESAERDPTDASRSAEDAINRSRFLASMGHTLRSPLNSILGFAELLLHGSGDPLNDRQRGHVQRMAEAGERQLEVINNLVELAQVHAGDISSEEEMVDPTAVVRAAIARFDSKASEKGARILFEAGSNVGHVYIDRSHLDRAVGILLSNATRHVGEAGLVEVTVSKDTSSGETGLDGAGVIRIEVSDSGPGIEAESAVHLFEDLGHGDALVSRRQQRNGTGLPLARRLLAMHGGRIWLEGKGKDGSGCCFIISLPPAGGRMPSPKPTAPDSADPGEVRRS